MLITETLYIRENTYLYDKAIQCRIPTGEICIHVESGAKLEVDRSYMDGNYDGPCIYINTDGELHLGGVTMFHCGGTGSTYGAVVAEDYTKITIESSMIRDNLGHVSGAHINRLSSLYISDCIFSNNLGDHVVYSHTGLVDVFNTTFTNTDTNGDFIHLRNTLANIHGTKLNNAFYGQTRHEMYESY